MITGYLVSRSGTDSKGVGPMTRMVAAKSRTSTFTSLVKGSANAVRSSRQFRRGWSGGIDHSKVVKLG